MQRLILRYFQPVLLWLQSKVQDIWPWCFTVPQFMVTMLQQHVVHHGCYFLSSGGSYSAELLVRTEKLATFFLIGSRRCDAFPVAPAKVLHFLYVAGTYVSGVLYFCGLGHLNGLVHLNDTIRR